MPCTSKNATLAREDERVEAISKPGGEDKVHGDPEAKEVLARHHKDSGLKSAADKARQV